MHVMSVAVQCANPRIAPTDKSALTQCSDNIDQRSAKGEFISVL